MAVNYTRVGWQDAPSTDTPIDAANLNHMDNGILALSEEVDTELPLLRDQINDVSADIETQIDEKISPEVSSWLTEHVDPVGSAVVVDDTLTIQGAAADAKKTGDEISDLKDDFSDLNLTYYFKDELLNNALGNTRSFNVDIPYGFDGSLCVKITNTASSAIYGQVYMFSSNNTQVYGKSELMESGTTITIKDIKPTASVSRIEIRNPVGVNGELVSCYMSYASAVINAISGDDPRTVIVDANGEGDFTDIQSAIDFCKKKWDVNTVPCTIYIKDGVYAVSPSTTYPFYAVDKGANRISIIGESVDHTIIECTCTSDKQGIALNIGGECEVKNLTIKNLADVSYTGDTRLEGNHRPYCIHNDTASANEDAPYITAVRNCVLYSEAMSPIGGGLHNNQMQIYENVYAEWSADAVDAPYTSAYTGSVYVHAPSSASAIALGVQFIDCIMVAKCDRPALQLPNVTGSQSMADIEQRFVRNVTASTGTIEVSLSAPNNKTLDSKMNSNSSLNR